MMEVIFSVFLAVVVLFVVLMVFDALAGVFLTIADWLRDES